MRTPLAARLRALAAIDQRGAWRFVVRTARATIDLNAKTGEWICRGSGRRRRGLRELFKTLQHEASA